MDTDVKTPRRGGAAARRGGSAWPAVALGLWLCLAPAAARAQDTPPSSPSALGLLQCLDLALVNDSVARQNPELKNWEREKLSLAQRRFLPRVDVDMYHQPKVDYFGRPLTEDDIYTNEVKVTVSAYASCAVPPAA
jgi:hypothetical protein